MHMHDSSAARRQRRIATMLLVVLIAGAAGFAGGQWWITYRYPILKEPAFANLNHSYKEILSSYMGEAEGNSLVQGAAAGMVASLNDPYSVYYTGEQGKTFLQRYEDHFVGIGVEIRIEQGEFVINSTVKGAPAEKAGVQAEDRIIAIDGKAVEGQTLEDIVGITRGEEGTTLALTLFRPSSKETVELSITRGEVPVTTVSSELLEGGVGLVTISRFSESTAKEFQRAVDKLEQQGMKGLLLDLRGNPGGLLVQTIDIASILIPKDQPIVQVVYKDEDRHYTHRSSQQKEWTLPIVVLVDENSASSSEVLAAALQANGALLVGQKTFGKGVVQTFRQFQDESVLKLTEAQWRTPEGNWIHKEGVQPDIEVSLPDFAKLPALSMDLELKEGDYGKEVRTAQRMLNVLGYGAAAREGVFDAATTAAVKAFQQSEELEADGVIRGGTVYRLHQRLAAKIVQEDTQQRRGVQELEARIGQEAGQQ